uniref:Uncharacterized protein n=1 Tax=Strigamia maritima TaxID=126957 RepID=T1JJ48_STRMM
MATTRFPGQKVILCGEFGVGKSSLFRRFSTNTFITACDRASTLGLDQYEKVYKSGGRDVKLQLWDTGGMERVASITSSYYKFTEAAILVFSYDNPESFNILSQHLLDIVTYAENAKIFLCGNKTDLQDQICITDLDIELFCVEEMFNDISRQLVDHNRSRKELETATEDSFKILQDDEQGQSCAC